MKEPGPSGEPLPQRRSNQVDASDPALLPPAAASPPPEAHGSEVASPTLPLPPPRDRESLDRFVEAIACTPNGRRADIRETIRTFGERKQVADLLHEALLTLPCTDSSRHHVLLSIIGELSEPSSVEVLERFVWMSDEDLHGAASDAPPDSAGCDLAPVGLLQARAAEMLAWVLKTEREDVLMGVISNHSVQSVRVAAIDAYLYHRDDDHDVVSGLRDRVLPEDGWAVGLVRRFRGMDAEDFDRLVGEHHAQHGTDPAAPQQSYEADDVP